MKYRVITIIDIITVVIIQGNKENQEWGMSYFKHLPLTLCPNGGITTSP